MALESVLERFVKESPVAVMARLTVQRAISKEWLDTVFEEHRETQYTRELLFSTVVEMMSLVTLGLRPSLHAAIKNADLPVSGAALYEKAKHTDLSVLRAMVSGSGERLAPVVAPMKKNKASLFPGYRIRVIDGNHLPASEKRLKPLRGFRGAALPGHSLVVYDPDQGLVVDLIPIEDAHAQERVAVPDALEAAAAGDLWIADRNFSTGGIFRRLSKQGAAFLFREHASSPNPTPTSERRQVGRTDTGLVFEQSVEIRGKDGETLPLRRIELHLDEPTEDGETVIRVLTNLPVEKASAIVIIALYRKRWTIENMFQRLESALQSELRSLGNPRAALLAFATAVVAFNALSALQSAVEAAHPEATAAGVEISTYYLADAVRAIYLGMMIAVPEGEWAHYESLSAAKLGRALIKIAGHVEPRRLRKHPRGPKKPTKKGYVSGAAARRHVSTARVLAQGGVKPTP